MTAKTASKKSAIPTDQDLGIPEMKPLTGAEMAKIQRKAEAGAKEKAERPGPTPEERADKLRSRFLGVIQDLEKINSAPRCQAMLENVAALRQRANSLKNSFDWIMGELSNICWECAHKQTPLQQADFTVEKFFND